jgi:hypothetical protein
MPPGRTASQAMASNAAASGTRHVGLQVSSAPPLLIPPHATVIIHTYRFSGHYDIISRDALMAFDTGVSDIFSLDVLRFPHISASDYWHALLKALSLCALYSATFTVAP